MTATRFQQASRPRVSLAVVTRNGISGYLEQTLASIRRHTEPPYELIVVDNGSADGTPELLLRRLTGATVILNTTNRGYGVATNQAASRATGDTLVLLNDDVFVHAGWLPPLLAALEDRDVGAVGPKILNVDGSLQQAGAVVTRSGATDLYGHGDDPTDDAYGYARVVDYVAGACLMIRRRIFQELGGFDPVYHPAYFEDTALCLAVRERGDAVIYEPRSIVTHVGGASGSAREQPDIPLRNRAFFELRWRTLLSGRPYAPLLTPRRIAAARDGAAAARVLVVGDAPRRGELALALTRACHRSRITLLAVDGETAPLLEAGVEVVRPAAPEQWLRDRRLHWDVVVARQDSALTPLIRATQPQAPLVDLTAEAPELPDTLARAGVPIRAHGEQHT